MVGPLERQRRRATQSRLISNGSAERGPALIGLFVGGLIGPGLLVVDRDHPHRGIFVIAISILMVAIALPAWLKGAKEQ